MRSSFAHFPRARGCVLRARAWTVIFYCGGFGALSLGGPCSAAETSATSLRGVTSDAFVIWKNGQPPSSVKAAQLPIGEWRGRAPTRRGSAASNVNPAAGNASGLQPASTSGRVPGDGGFAGVHVTAETARVVDLVPWAAVTIGMTKDAAQRILGDPEIKLRYRWFYADEGWLAFGENHTITAVSFPIPPAPGPVKTAEPAVWRQLRPGMSKSEILAHLGTPEIKLTYKWFYGPAHWIASMGA